MEKYRISEGSLISFDLTSEEFNVIKLPEVDIRVPLVKYNGKIALSCQYPNGKFDLWVLEDASKQEWPKVSLVVPSWTDLVVGGRYLNFRGTLSTGELIFSPQPCRNPLYLISLDLKENNAKKVLVEGLGDKFPNLEVYLDHVDSPMVLSNVS
ncbi:PREDICTED: F-box/kelch-repeat protein At3g04660-like [Camelina sativa]|uniref:F-box/kelch-repeat protein At3g04660-like n=1 Tax=Camelina sativa TaxID=90675 RepID=A0ABM0SXT0_CAMSA|nr:PREDICTED: F-box/kelch-repeat protein At3g04660-like [Camelina sativa]